jgi:tetratricopeptide (TPR) repeat protein
MWFEQGNDALKSAREEVQGKEPSFKAALAQLKKAEASFQHAVAWYKNAHQALTSAAASRAAAQQQVDRLPPESSRGLVSWPETLTQRVEQKLERDDGTDAVAEAERIAHSIPESRELFTLRQVAVSAAREARDSVRNVEGLKERYAAADERVQEADNALKQDRWPDALRFYTAARDLYRNVLADVNTRLNTVVAAGNQVLQAKDYKQAIASFDEALKIRPDDPTYSRQKERAEIDGQIAAIQKLERAGQADDAAQQTAELLRSKRDDAIVQRFVADVVSRIVNAGNDALNREDFDTASETFLRLRGLRPTSELTQYGNKVKSYRKYAEDRAEEQRKQNERNAIARQKADQDRIDRQRREAREEADRTARDEAIVRGYGNPNSNTFGALGVDNPNAGGGIFLTGSNPGTPAAGLGLEYGDVIVSINGSYVNTQSEFVAAVHSSPDVMNFVLRNVRTGQLQNMSVRLARRR